MRRKVMLFVLAPIAVVAIAALLGYVVMQLWNGVLAPATGWHALTFWQAIGLLILSKILFGGFRGPGRDWQERRRMRERWEAMTPEEREKFREGMRSRCGGWTQHAP